MSLTGINFNGAGEQRGGFEIIPVGVVAPFEIKIIPGKISLEGMSPDDEGLFSGSQSSDAVYLRIELTAIDGTYKGRKIWTNWTVAGGKVSETGESIAWNITKASILALLNSVHDLDPKDESEGARQRRVLASFSALDGLVFPGKVGIQKEREDEKTGKKYPASNTLACVLTKDMKDYPKSQEDFFKTPVSSAVPSGPVVSKPAWAQAAPAPVASAPTAPAAQVALASTAAFTVAQQPAPAATDTRPAWARRAA